MYKITIKLTLPRNQMLNISPYLGMFCRAKGPISFSFLSDKTRSHVFLHWFSLQSHRHLFLHNRPFTWVDWIICHYWLLYISQHGLMLFVKASTQGSEPNSFSGNDFLKPFFNHFNTTWDWQRSLVLLEEVGTSGRRSPQQSLELITPSQRNLPSSL